MLMHAYVHVCMHACLHECKHTRLPILNPIRHVRDGGHAYMHVCQVCRPLPSLDPDPSFNLDPNIPCLRFAPHYAIPHACTCACMRVCMSAGMHVCMYTRFHILNPIRHLRDGGR